MLRAVLDANVFVSAFLQPKGPSGCILRSFLEQNSFELVLSESILAEVRGSMRYPRVRRRLALSDLEIEARIASIGLLADLVSGGAKVHAVKDDPDDDKYVEAALEGHAGFVVSGDSHLLMLQHYEGIQILGPRQFLNLIEAAPTAPAPSGQD
jgi:hypothetical protein